MKRYVSLTIITVILSLSVLSGRSHAYWVWTPETKKFINPKYAVKDTPKEQYEWAMSFYDSKDYKRAATEFEKLVKNYEYSEYAADSQYRVGLSYDSQGKYYIAFQNYQKAIDNFPHVSNIDEIIAREFNIANIYASKQNPKVLGTEIMTSYDRAIEIYNKVVDNAPFGKFADEAQFKMATTMKESGRYDEATLAFQKILDDYPASKLYAQAKYEMADSAYKASLQPAYDAAPTDKALKAFEDFTSTTSDEKLNKEAQGTIKRLKNKAAEKSFLTAEFYEQQKHYASAIIYYQDVIDRYPDSISAGIAIGRIADLKSGNYSHKSQEALARQKQGWTAPWSAKDKKAATKPPKVKKVKVSAPAAAGAPSAEKPAEAPAQAEPAVTGAQQTEAKPQSQESPDKAAADTPEAVKTSPNKRWWAYGLAEKRDENRIKLYEDESKKRWSPINLNKKTEGIKKDE